MVGVLTVSHTIGGLYKEEEMTLLYKITSQASQAVTKLEEVVRNEQKKLSAMVESMGDGIIMTDMDYRVIVSNPAALSLIGFSRKDSPTVFDFIDGLGGIFDIRGRLEEAVKLKKDFLIDKVAMREKFYQIFVFPVFVDKSTRGEVLGGVVIFHDVTKEIEVEKMREDFTHMIVHELRSPLDGIKKISETLRTGDVRRGAKAFKEYLQMIYQNSSSMLELIGNILDVAKVESGKFEVFAEDADLGSLIENRVSFYELSAKDRGIAIDFIRGKSPIELKLDKEGIKQVLNNYISNALKFTSVGGRISIVMFKHTKGADPQKEFDPLSGLPSPISLSDLGTAEGVVVGVADNGSGIEPEDLGLIFSKYKQIKKNNVKLGAKGTGLGLTIAKGVVESHGGITGVRSQIGVGSTFFFVLPLNSSKVSSTK